MFRYLCISFILISLPAHSYEDFSVKHPEVKRYLQQKEDSTNFVVYSPSIEMKYGDLNFDNIDDLVLKFTMEVSGQDGNGYMVYLAAFTRRQGRDSYQFASDIMVGSKTTRDVSLHSMENGVINLSTYFISRSKEGGWNAFCCKKGEGTAHYTLYKNTLLELNQAPKKYF